jgi:cellulose synthase operon protein C
MTLRGVALCALALLAAGPVAAEAERPAALVACDREKDRGRLDEARRCYTALLEKDPPPALGAEAHWALGDPKRANAEFRRAAEAEPRNADVQLRWGLLYLETHQPGEARALFDRALELEPGHVGTTLALARLRAESSDPSVRAEVEALARAAPQRLDAELLLTRIALEEGDRAAARAALERSARVEECSRLDLERHALHASLDAVEGRSESRWSERALACNPRSGTVFATPAYFLTATRRYRDAIALLQRAVEVEPTLWSAHADLAMQLMRESRLGEARRHLEIAYGGDPFSPEVVNQLRLLDKIESFEPTYVAKDPAAKSGASERVRILLDPKEAGVLAGYVGELTTKALDHFAQKYRFEPREPVVVELYPDHDDFAVRTAGLPGLGILGATFGYVVAMDSPSARPPDQEVHWGSVLWHELAHVITLEASEHRVPRWFSEGISVYEERESGPAPQRALADSFLQALRQERLLPVGELDRGFERPSFPGQVEISYEQAGLVCTYIAKRFGFERLVEILQGFTRGTSTAELLPRVLDMPLERFDADFLAFAREQAGALLERPEEWRAAQRAGQEALRARRWAELLKHAENALALNPADVSAGSAHLWKARAHRELGDVAAATAALETYGSRGGRDPGALKQLAADLHAAGRRSEAIAALSELRYVTPFDEELHSQLADWLLAEDRPRPALDELRILQALEPLDRVALYFRMARAYHALKVGDEARRHVLYALELAPDYRPAQRLLLEIRR